MVKARRPIVDTRLGVLVMFNGSFVPALAAILRVIDVESKRSGKRAAGVSYPDKLIFYAREIDGREVYICTS